VCEQRAWLSSEIRRKHFNLNGYIVLAKDNAQRSSHSDSNETGSPLEPGSHGKMVAHMVIGQFLDGTAGHTAALLEDAKFSGHTPGEQQLLLDQHHGHPGLVVELDNDIADFVNEVGLQTFEWVEIDHKRWPFNPVVNVGAILLASMLPKDTSERRRDGFLSFVRQVYKNAKIEVDEAVY